MRRRKSQPGRTFALTVLLLLAIALLSLLLPSLKPYKEPLLASRDLSTLDHSKSTCRQVHQARDKCAFIKSHCPDEDDGFFSYLTLYYCDLPNAKPFAFLIIVTWAALLFTTIGVAASDFFCVNLSTISSILGMSESMAGVTFLAFGNGSPDVFSTFSAMNSNAASLAIGELIGAAGFITAVVAGSMALIRPFKVAKKSFMRDVCFFIVATCFSMVFLANGRLDFWECAVMVGFYAFYVFTVFVWHWWLGHRRRGREAFIAARGDFSYPGNEQVEVLDTYHDDDDDASTVRPTRPGRASSQNLSVLELANGDEYDDPDEDELRDKWMGELSSNMRLSRIPTGERRTVNPIRPSLVGALEFQAVLSALQKNSNLQAAPVNLRRYSDDPHFTTAQQQQVHVNVPDPLGTSTTFEASVREYKAPTSKTSKSRPARLGLGNRARAVSVNDAAHLRFDPGLLSEAHAVALLDTPMEAHEEGESNAKTLALPSPALSISLPEGEEYEADEAPGSLPRPQAKTQALHASRSHSRPKLSAKESDGSTLNRSFSEAFLALRNLPGSRRSSPGPSPGQSPFIPYSDTPASRSASRVQELTLPTPSVSPEPVFGDLPLGEGTKPRWSWYPYRTFPTPMVILRTLFPTLCSWRNKSVLAKFLGIASAPSILLLTITLPVVDLTGEDEQMLTPASTVVKGGIQSSDNIVENQRRGSLATPAVLESELPREASHPDLPFAIATAEPTGAASPSHWSRWLTIIHCFTAPWFVTFILWLNLEGENASSRDLIKLSLYSLLASLVALLIILTTTVADRAPRWHFLLCFVGFVVSVAWISTIADQTVSVLKAIGVILNISEAVLGLTIFAVGASLGDLVSDISIARLGFPVMAMSACIAGPLMNILLGIGLSGMYASYNGADARHRKHPDRPVKCKPYLLDISTTLMISAVTLLVTLLVLLVAVPLNGWMMDRKIGAGLVAIWSVGTVVNLVVEATGLGA